MKKTILILTAAIAMMLILVGCGTTTVMSGDMSDDGKSYVVTFDGADEGDFMMSGALAVEEGDTIQVEADIEEEATVECKLIETLSDEDADEEELEEITDTEDAAYEFSVSGNDSVNLEAVPGSYYVHMEAETKATGTVTLTVVSSSN